VRRYTDHGAGMSALGDVLDAGPVARDDDGGAEHA
jgi:hypothetical protein